MNIQNQFEDQAPADVLAQPAFLKTGLDALEAFADRAEDVEKALSQLEQAAGSAAGRSIKRLRRELDSFEPAVTFLGQVKSGKTTLVNAVAGWSDLLPSDVNPWTSVITSLHLAPGADRQDVSARFQMMEEAEWDRLVRKGGRLGELAGRAGSDGEMDKIRTQVENLREKSRRRLGRKFELLLGQAHEYGYFDKNLLERYICIGDDFYEEETQVGQDEQGRFADITRSADLYLRSSTMPYKLCLRDTPGVNDTFMMREQVTINAVRTSRLCVVVLSAHQALTSVDMALIRMISSLQSRDVVIFVNRIDELQDPATQIPEIEASIRQVLKDHKGPEDARVIFGSALWANQVLSGETGAYDAGSTDTLSAYAHAIDLEDLNKMSAAERKWHVSGLPALNAHIAARVVEVLCDPHLLKITSSAISIASGQQAADKVRIDGAGNQITMSLHEVRGEMTTLAQVHRQSLLRNIEQIVLEYQGRADRANANFIDRATHSLIAHLENKGDTSVWNCDPTGLRMLLKSAYSVFAIRAQKKAKADYEEAVVAIAKLYHKAFGSAVEGIELNVPDVQDFPAPVTIAQTIALDFNDSWWVSWWRRTRGYKAFANQFQKLVTAETEDFMYQLKVVQTDQIRTQMVDTLNAFFEQNRDIMLEISGAQGAASDVQRICLGQDEAKRLETIEHVLADLRFHSGPTQWKGKVQ